jgi:nucleotide-binding universal stress UspA family protein
MACLVVTTDLSPESQRAFAPAAALADRLGLEIVLFAVLEDMPFEPTAGGMVVPYPDRAQLHRDWEQKLRELAGTLHCKRAVRTTCVDAMDVPRAIVEFAQQQNAAYVAMATHGRAGLRRLLLGSVAEAVLRHSHVPLILYPPPAA